MIRRLLVIELAGAAIRELLPLLRRLADYCDPAGTAPGWTAPKPKPAPVPDYIPDALLVRW